MASVDRSSTARSVGAGPEPPGGDQEVEAAVRPTEAVRLRSPRFGVLPALGEVLAGKRTLTLGETGGHVLEVEKALVELGYRLGGLRGPDRELARSTQNAIARFQRDHGLAASGDLDAETLQALDQAVWERRPPVDRGNPWRDAAGRFTSARGDLDGLPRYVPDNLAGTLRALAGEVAADDVVVARLHLEDPAASAPAEVELPKRWFSFDERGIPLPGPVGPRVALDVRSTGSTSVDSTPAAASVLTGDYLVASDSDAVDELTAFATANRTLEMAERYTGGRIDWGKKGQLTLRPFYRDEKNASYSAASRDVAFGYVVGEGREGYTDLYRALSDTPYRRALRRDGAFVASSGIPDVVAHESGHALLDALSPLTVRARATAPEWAAIHEAFGDVTALLAALSTDTVLDSVLEETGGDLSRPNRAARLAEAFGMDDGVDGQRKRNALVLYAYDPKNPPKIPHDQSVTLSAAVYDGLRRITDEGRARGLPSRQALAEARDVIGRLAFSAAKLPLDGFAKFAAGFLAEDVARFGGRHAEALESGFRALGILVEGGVAPEEVPSLTGLRGFTPRSVGRWIEKQRAPLGLGPDEAIRNVQRETLDGGRRMVTFVHGEGADARRDVLVFDAEGRSIVSVRSPAA